MSAALEKAIREKLEIKFNGWEGVYDIPAHMAASKNIQYELRCPQCHCSTVVCCYVDLGHLLDYLDQFCHICLNPTCQYGEEFNERRIGGQERNQDGICPFCRRNVFLDPA